MGFQKIWYLQPPKRKLGIRAVYGLPGSHWFMAFSSILVIYGKQLELDGS